MRTGVFDAQKGTLSFSLEQDAVANQAFSVNFMLAHVAEVLTQPMRILSGEAHTPVCIRENNPLCVQLPGASLGRIELNANLSGSILGVAEGRKLRIHAISEVSEVFGALSIITIDLQANFEMLAGYRVSMSGLDGMSLSGESASVLTAVQDRINLLPNCSCTTFEGDLCDCTSGRRSTIQSQFRIWQPDGFFGDEVMDGDVPVTETVQGTWTQDAMRSTLDVTLKAGTTIAAEVAWKFSFVVECSQSASVSAARVVSVMDQGGKLVVDHMLNGTMCRGLKSPDFTGVWIEEDSSVLSGQSNITLSVSLTSPLVSLEGVGATMTISGLNGFQTPSGLRLREHVPAITHVWWS